MSVRIEHGDCMDVLPALLAEGVLFDSVVCDPPYGLAFMGKGWDEPDNVAFRADTWRAVLAVMKPGAHLIAFSGTRTYHRMACAIEDAGFEVRDQLGWLYGAGFPKSHNTSRALDGIRCNCASNGQTIPECDVRPLRDADVSSSLNSSDERREVLHESLSQSSAHGAMLWGEPAQGGQGLSERCLEGRSDAQAGVRELQGRSLRPCAGLDQADGEEGRLHHGASPCHGDDVRSPDDAERGRQSYRPQPGEQPSEQLGDVAGQPQPQAGGVWPLCGGCGKPSIPDGLGTALKPAWEPIVLARAPFRGTVAANVQAHGTGALNIDGCRVGANDGDDRARPPRTPNSILGGGSGTNLTASEHNMLGRWPANVIHDGSDEVLAAFPETTSGSRAAGDYGVLGGDVYSRASVGPMPALSGSEGSAARFFYSAKADAGDRLGSKHPTVKPVDLMAYLCRLVTPPGGLILDLFAGSGTTGMACLREGFDAVLIEREAEYVADIRRRIAHVQGLDTALFGAAA